MFYRLVRNKCMMISGITYNLKETTYDLFWTISSRLPVFENEFAITHKLRSIIYDTCWAILSGWKRYRSKPYFVTYARCGPLPGMNLQLPKNWKVRLPIFTERNDLAEMEKSSLHGRNLSIRDTTCGRMCPQPPIFKFLKYLKTNN